MFRISAGGVFGLWRNWRRDYHAFELPFNYRLLSFQMVGSAFVVSNFGLNSDPEGVVAIPYRSESFYEKDLVAGGERKN